MSFLLFWGIGWLVAGLLYPTAVVVLALWQVGHKLTTGEWYQSARVRRRVTRQAAVAAVTARRHLDPCRHV